MDWIRSGREREEPGLTYVWVPGSLKDGISIDLDGGAPKGGLGKRLGVWRAEVSERDSSGLEDCSEVRSEGERAAEGDCRRVAWAPRRVEKPGWGSSLRQEDGRCGFGRTELGHIQR